MLYLITWLTDFAVFLLIFSVSRLLAEQQATALSMGVIGALFSAACTISNVASGRLSDRLGRRSVAASGMLLLLAGVCGATWIDSGHPLYYVSYGCCGIGAGAVYPSLIAWLSHGRTGRAANRVFLGFCLSFNLGLVAGQLVGGTLFEYMGYRWPLYAAMGLLTTALLLIFKRGETSRDTISAIDPQDEVAAGERVLSSAFFRVCWVANFGGAFSVSMVFYLLPKIVVQLEISSVQHGAMLAASRTVVIATLLTMYATSFWRHRLSTALATQAMGIVGLIGLVLSQTIFGLTVSLILFSVLPGYNYFSSLYYSNTGSADHQKGSASGIHEATLAFGFAGGSLFGGLVGESFGDRAPFVLSAALVLTLAIVQTAVYLKLVRPLLRKTNGDRTSESDEPILPVPADPAA